MYRLFLAIRYLMTRPINLLGMGGIMISVWALVVVVSLFSGFIATVEEHVHSASSDITVAGLPAWAEWPSVRAALADDVNVKALAPRVLHYGILNKPGQRPQPPPLPGRGALHGGDQPFLFVLGIDTAAETEVTGLSSWLRNAEIPDALRATDLIAPLAPHDGVPGILIGLDRMRREGLHPGDRVTLTSARLHTDAEGNKTPEQITLDLQVAGA
ncbi:MAG: hypothetical protein ABIP94_21045, partial [Planctomycetota bacterium]